MFEAATRLKLRFDSTKGQLQIEDLWDLPLTSTKGQANLDDIARGLHRQLKNSDDVSFVNVDQKSDAVVQIKFDIVKHIIDVRLAENAAAATARANKEQKQKLMAIRAQRSDDALQTVSIEELDAMIAAL